MTNSPTSWRFPRLQFSLRGLILLMFLVGVGLAVFRWPWLVETARPDGMPIKTQYRRAWNFKAVKHGSSWEGEPSRLAWESLFHDGELYLQRIWDDWKVVGETAYRNGKEHGVTWGNWAGVIPYGGEYFEGEFHGEWKSEYSDHIEYTTWNRGKKQGLNRWETKAGRVLQTAEYQDGRVVKWNGQPIMDEVHRWLADNIPGLDTRRLLMQPIYDQNERCGVYGEVEFFVADVEVDPGVNFLVQHKSSVLVYGEKVLDRGEQLDIGKPLAEALLVSALENSHTFAFRFNRLNIVPISEASLHWKDRTGVYDVEFPADSEQEKAWLKPIVANPFKSEPGMLLAELVSPNRSGPIQVDASALLKPAKLGDGVMLGGGSLKNLPHVPTARRDLLGYHLDREGCYCVQEGNKLILKRH